MSIQDPVSPYIKLLHELELEVETQWLIAHLHVCTDKEDCKSFGGKLYCNYPRPPCLKGG